MVFLGCQDWQIILGDITDVHVLDILVSVDSEDFFHNFCDGGRFLKR